MRKKYAPGADNQRIQIIQYWKNNNPQISTTDLRMKLGIMSPSARIAELRKRGHKITTHYIEELDNNGAIHRNGLYVYHGKITEELSHE